MGKIKSFCIVFATLCIGLLSFVSATEIPTNATINDEPYVESISLNDNDGGTLQIWANDSRIFNCTGTVYDGDGFGDISVVNATIFGFSSNASAADSSGRHYTNNSCAVYGSSGNTSSFSCTFRVHHHSQNGTWTCNASVNDSYSTHHSNTSTNTVDVFKSIAVPLQTIEFGAYANGQNSGTTDSTVTVNNTGNVLFNVTLDAYRTSGVPADIYSMACTGSGNLPVSSIVYSASAGVTALSKTPLANAPTEIPANVVFTAYGATLPVSYSFYLGIIIPISGQGGVCNGFLDVTAT